MPLLGDPGHYWIEQTPSELETALGMLKEAMAFVDKSAERCYEAELHRLKGSILFDALNTADCLAACSDEAETCFRDAIALARQQGARSLELRAALGLARLWQRKGNIAEARQALSDVYGRFTEGFDTADLQEAKELLDTLAPI
jgi:adenylate cyclase